jgi:hypothetical protein
MPIGADPASQAGAAIPFGLPPHLRLPDDEPNGGGCTETNDEGGRHRSAAQRRRHARGPPGEFLTGLLDSARSRLAVMTERAQSPITTSFVRDIRPLSRPRDIEHMRDLGIDLADLGLVKESADRGAVAKRRRRRSHAAADRSTLECHPDGRIDRRGGSRDCRPEPASPSRDGGGRMMLNRSDACRRGTCKRSAPELGATQLVDIAAQLSVVGTGRGVIPVQSLVQPRDDVAGHRTRPVGRPRTMSSRARAHSPTPSSRAITLWSLKGRYPQVTCASSSASSERSQ